MLKENNTAEIISIDSSHNNCKNAISKFLVNSFNSADKIMNHDHDDLLELSKKDKTREEMSLKIEEGNFTIINCCMR